MAAKSNTLSNQLLALIFNGTSIPGIADNTATVPLTQLWFSLHTASPAATGNQTTNEAAYAGYARQAVARSTAGFLVSGEAATLVANLPFPTATGGSEQETYYAIGTVASGTGEILYYGPLVPVVNVSVNVTPVMVSGTLNGTTVTES